LAIRRDVVVVLVVLVLVVLVVLVVMLLVAGGTAGPSEAVAARGVLRPQYRQ